MAANKACINRLQKEYRVLLKEPVPGVTAHPSPASLLEWHFVLEGDRDTDFRGGVYHGKIVFPPQYPFQPPSISLFTPTGRFATNTKLCLSMTDYHPESWNPLWSVGTILTGLLSFMHDNQPTTGSIKSTPEEKHALAASSLDFNLKNPIFRKLFPEWAEEGPARRRRQEALMRMSEAQPAARVDPANAPPPHAPLPHAANGAAAQPAANGRGREETGRLKRRRPGQADPAAQAIGAVPAGQDVHPPQQGGQVEQRQPPPPPPRQGAIVRHVVVVVLAAAAAALVLVAAALVVGGGQWRLSGGPHVT